MNDRKGERSEKRGKRVKGARVEQCDLKLPQKILAEGVPPLFPLSVDEDAIKAEGVEKIDRG